MSANLRTRKTSSLASERHSVNAERRSPRKQSPKKNNSKEKVDNKRKSHQKKMPSPAKNTATRRSSRGKNEEVVEQLEPVKRRKFASGKGLEKMAEAVEVESDDIEEKTLATKKQDESPMDSVSSSESVDSDRPEHHHDQKDLPDKYQSAGFDISFFTKHMLLDMYPSKSH